jgi:long-chain acyl-CoA synthetase
MTTNAQTPLDIFYYWESKTPDNIFLRQPINDVWKTWTYRQAGDEIRRLASALKALDIPPKSNISILSKNCAHWIMADIAIWMAGHVTVTVYPTLSADNVEQILVHSESKVVIIGKLDDFSKQRPAILPGLKCIGIQTYGIDHGDRWEDLIRQYQPLKDVKRDPDELATIKYTSGTTGKPKGAMITFGALHHVTTEALKGFRIPAHGQRFFSYLPLSHIAERMLIEMGGIYSGASISFTESIEKFPQNLSDVQPTIFLAVPRIWSKFQEKILEKMPNLEKLLRIPVINFIVKKAITKKLGLKNAVWKFTGAAPISKSLLEWYQRLGITINEVLGMTENLAYSHLNLNKIKFGTVGQAWHHVQTRFTEEGEILMKHPWLMTGYYREPELTKESFTEDGFLKTGDKGEIDDEGFITVTGRVKDQFKTDKAKYIDPAPIELKIAANIDIDQVCVVGTGLPQPIALAVLSPSGKKKSKDEIEMSIATTLQEVNETLASYERIQSAVILKEDWTIENGLMTPSLKVKRNEVERKFFSQYQNWYKKSQVIVWEVGNLSN